MALYLDIYLYLYIFIYKCFAYFEPKIYVTDHTHIKCEALKM